MRNVLFIWILSFLLIACSRISVKDNLEKIAEIELPAGYTVLSDEYQNTGDNFFIQYNIRFDKDSTSQMIHKIKSSKYYSSTTAQLVYDSIWYTDHGLYKFEARNESADRKYEITFNPVTGVLNYLEYSERMKL